MNGDVSTTGPLRQRASILAAIWIALLGWIALGGAIAQVLLALHVAGPYCEFGQQGIYPTCTPCALTTGVFGVVGMNPCPNAALATLSAAGMETPHIAVIFLTMLAYPLEERLREVWIGLPALVVMAPLIAALARTIYANCIEQPRIMLGLHRALLVCIALLVMNLAMMWGGAWPWLRAS